MADAEKKVVPQKRISEKQRFKYIGFEVFPGTPKDLFKSDAEKQKLIDQMHARRDESGIREHCTLLEERVTLVDRVVLTVTCLVIVAALLLPWYSAYNEVTEDTTKEATTAMTTDSLMTDSTLAVSPADTVEELTAVIGEDAQLPEGEVLPDEQTPDATAAEELAARGAAVVQGEHEDEEIIHGYVARKAVRREFSKLSGIGSILALGSAGSLLFSSGGILILTGIIMLLYTLACIVMPLYTLWGIYGAKGNADDKALHLKRIVKFNWIPVILFLLTAVLSFFGAEYGFDPTAVFASIGDSYGPGVFMGSLSWGVFVSLAGFIMLAVKGIEI